MSTKFAFSPFQSNTEIVFLKIVFKMNDNLDILKPHVCIIYFKHSLSHIKSLLAPIHISWPKINIGKVRTLFKIIHLDSRESFLIITCYKSQEIYQKHSSSLLEVISVHYLTQITWTYDQKWTSVKWELVLNFDKNKEILSGNYLQIMAKLLSIDIKDKCCNLF